MPPTWLQTSQETSIRKQSSGRGGTSPWVYIAGSLEVRATFHQVPPPERRRSAGTAASMRRARESSKSLSTGLRMRRIQLA